MIPSTQIINTEMFAFIAVVAFRLSNKVLFVNRKDNRNYKNLLFKKIANFTGKLPQNYK